MSNEMILMPRSLTAENGAKAAMIGEFSESIVCPCEACTDMQEVDPDCPECGGDGESIRHVKIQWTTIKEIYASAVKLLGQEIAK